MKYDEFQKAVDRIIEDGDTLMIHVSPDFHQVCFCILDHSIWEIICWYFLYLAEDWNVQLEN